MMLPALLFGYLLQTKSPPGKVASEVMPIFTSICELSANPTAFNGKLVTVQVRFETDGIERSLLIDDACAGGAVLPWVADGAFGSKSLDEAIGTGRPRTLDKKIVATFTGRFHFSSKPEMCMILNKAVCQRTLEITSIRNLVLTMKQREN